MLTITVTDRGLSTNVEFVSLHETFSADAIFLFFRVSTVKFTHRHLPFVVDAHCSVLCFFA